MIVTALVCLAMQTCRQEDVNVIDGATFSVAGETVRIRGIDVPHEDGGCHAERHMANVAVTALENALDGRRVEINMTGRTNDGRMIAGVTTDGRNVADAMYAMGLARRWGATPDGRSWCDR